MFEKIICRQLSNHFDNILSKFQCDFRKDYSPQHCLLLMIDKWKKAVDNHKVFGAVLTDLSKAFDCISHDLLIAKLNAYGLFLPALKLISDYLQNRKQIPAGIKNKDSLDGFKKEIKKWKPTECPCRICKTFVPNLGFFDKNINISRIEISSF